MSAKQSLGRGFDALIPKDLDPSLLAEDDKRVQRVSISDIRPNPNQPRREFAAGELKELSDSIKSHGVLQPLIVVRAGSGYRLVAGERRWRAAQAAKLKYVPAIVHSLKELEEIELSLIENIQRVDLSPLEQAMAVYKLQHQFNLSLEQISRKLGKAVSTISNLMRLLQLPAAAAKALRDARISEGHARAILALKGREDKQQELLGSILNNGWSVRQAERFVLEVKGTAAKARTPKQTALTKRLSSSLKTDVKVRSTARGGQLIISFKNRDQLEEIAKKLENRPS